MTVSATSVVVTAGLLRTLSGIIGTWDKVTLVGRAVT